MNIVSIKRGIRRVGLNYGLPMFFIECGCGPSCKLEDSIKELGSKGACKNDWVCILNGAEEKGVGTFVEAVRHLGLRVEVEASGTDLTPGWFPSVNTWTVYWEPKPVFNYGALRNRQDILLLDLKGISESMWKVPTEVFIRETSKFPVDKGIVGKEVLISGVRSYNA